MVTGPSLHRGKYAKTILGVITCFFLLWGLVFPDPSYSAGRTIGVIMTGDTSYYRDIHDSFMAKLRKEGYGDSATVIVQKPYPDLMSLSNAARKLIAHEVDVIVAYGTPSALAITREKSKIPVIYAGVYEPFNSRIEGKNSAGISVKVSVSSLLRYLKGMTGISNLGVLYSENEENSLFQMRELEKIGGQYGMKITGINLKRHQEAKGLLGGKKVDALFITESSIASLAMSSITEFARQQGIPTASLLPDKNSHIIVTLFASPKELGDKSAEMAIKVLGERTADRVKSVTARDIELVFDLKELVGMGLKIPMDLVTEATRIIQ